MQPQPQPQFKGAAKKDFYFKVGSASQREGTALAFPAQPIVALQAQAASQISPVVAAATSAAQVVTGTQPVAPTTKTTLSVINERLSKHTFIPKTITSIGSKIDRVGVAGLKYGIIPITESIIKSPKYVTGFFGGIHTMLPYRLIFMFLFFFVFYRIIYNICIFFGIDQIILSMYMGWVSFIIVLFTFLPYDYGNILDE
jgi:hypothetical protein